MSRCPTCDSKTDCEDWCGESVQGLSARLNEQIESLQSQLAAVTKALDSAIDLLRNATPFMPSDSLGQEWRRAALKLEPPQSGEGKA